MTIMTGYFAADAKSPDQYSRGSSWFQFRSRFKASKRDQAVFAALIAPSLVAEIAPLIYLWDAHLPVWQISVMMAVSWAVGWWATWIIAASVRKERNLVTIHQVGRSSRATCGVGMTIL